MARPSSTLCPSCGQLVGVNDEQCLNCGRRNPGMFGLSQLLRGVKDDTAFAQLVTWVCGLLFVASFAVDPEGIQTGGLMLFSPSTKAALILGASGAIPVLQWGHWWTVLSAGWLHGGVIHILFNMFWVRDLAPATSRLYGPGRTVIIYTVSGAVGFLASSLAVLIPFTPFFLRGGTVTLGASASIFGLLGALLHYGRRGGSSHIGRQAKTFAIVLLLLGFILPGVDNWAHLGGLGGGYLLAKWLDPLKPERGDHLIVAAVCLLASLLAIIASVVWASGELSRSLGG